MSTAAGANAAPAARSATFITQTLGALARLLQVTNLERIPADPGRRGNDQPPRRRRPGTDPGGHSAVRTGSGTRRDVSR